MNKKTILAIGALVIFAATAYFYKNSLNSSLPTGPQINETSNIDNIKGSLQDLIARNQSMQCTFSYTQDANTTDGKVYLAGNKMRGDFKTTYNGQTIDSSLIRDGDYAYTWSSIQPQGTKMKLDDLKSPQDTKSDDKPESFSLDDQQVDYNCQPWTKDSSMFTPPSNIEFLDISQQVKDIQETTQDLQDIKCSACDQVPAGQAKDQCLASLGC